MSRGSQPCCSLGFTQNLHERMRIVAMARQQRSRSHRLVTSASWAGLDPEAIMSALLSTLRELEHHARRHIAMREAVEHIVDRRERLQLDIGFDLAVSGEGKRFGHVAAIADEGAANRDAVRHDIEQAAWETRPAAAQPAHRYRICASCQHPA